MIVDDSVVARAVLSRMVESDGGFEIAAVAGTAEDAIVALGQVRVDIVLLDLDMPGAGGLRSIPQIIAAAAGAHVMVVSSLAEDGAEQTIAALALGASDALPKPGTGRFNGRFSDVLLSRLRALGYAGGAAPVQQPSPNGPAGTVLRPMACEPLRLLALGASTGGIHALGSFFASLPPRIGVPILVTQHLPVAFMGVFARQLAVAARRPAIIAEDGMALRPDQILVAPGDSHLAVSREGDGHVARLQHSRSPSGCLPSLDPMLESAGIAFGGGALAVVLTGMGRDGVAGAARLVQRGGSVLAQDEGSSAVWGMPRAIVDAGLACGVLPPDKLARRVAKRIAEAPCR
jgi:two-component system, chemotaxis family, protein-glutamate methylesterase/glutaminase